MRGANWRQLLLTAVALAAGALLLAVAARGTFHTWKFFDWPPMVGFGGRRYDLTTCTPTGGTPDLRYIGNALWFPVYTDANELRAHRTRNLVIMEVYLHGWRHLCRYTIEGGP